MDPKTLACFFPSRSSKNLSSSAPLTPAIYFVFWYLFIVTFARVRYTFVHIFILIRFLTPPIQNEVLFWSHSAPRCRMDGYRKCGLQCQFAGG